MYNDKFEYKGYYTIKQYNETDNVYYGRLSGIRDLVSFHSDTDEGFEKAFQEAVEDYFDFCKEMGKTPEKPTMKERKGE